MMKGRKKTKVASLFTDVEDAGKTPKVKCKYCCLILTKNGTRMSKHIKSCTKCSKEIKLTFLSSGFKKVTAGTEEVDYVAIISDEETEGLPQEMVKDPLALSFPTKSNVEYASTIGITKSRDLHSKTQSTSKLCCCGKNPINSFVDNMSNFQLKELQLEFAKSVYESGCPLNMVTHKTWINFYQKLRPAFRLPNRDQISNSMLDAVFQETSRSVQQNVHSAKSVALLCDAWSNIRNEGIINFVVTTPKPMIWRSIMTGSDAHTGEYMAQTIKGVIEEIGPMKVLGICTDNAANMKKSWELLLHDFPHIQFYGCFAHTLHLLLSDIIKIKEVESIRKDCVNLAKAIKLSQVLSALLKGHQISQKTSRLSLKLPVTTRWGSIVHCLASVVLNKHSLPALAVDQKSQKYLGASIKSLILSEDFWSKSEYFWKLLKPVAEAILLVEGDNTSLSIVPKVFKDLEDSFRVADSASSILESLMEKITTLIETRKTFIIKGIHLAANLLDPRYKGCHLSDEERMDAVELISSISKSIFGICEDRNSQLLADLGSYNAKDGIFSRSIAWEFAKNTKPSNWWVTVLESSPLSEIAPRILELPPTSAAVERSFSRCAWIHSKTRNRLTTERANKLVYISHNFAINEKEEAQRSMPSFLEEDLGLPHFEEYDVELPEDDYFSIEAVPILEEENSIELVVESLSDEN